MAVRFWPGSARKCTQRIPLQKNQKQIPRMSPEPTPPNTAPILVTGGAQRVGLHLCEQLIARGERIILTYRRERPVLDALRAQGVITLQADFSTQEGVFAFVAALKQATNSLRAIIHNASTWSKDAAVLGEPAHFTELMNVHVFAPYWINLHCEDLLRKGEGLRDIIAISDHTVSRGSDKHAAYLASKAGLESLTLSFAKRFAPRIKVNAIAPALVMFNEGDSAEYRAERLKRSALQIEPGPGVVFDAVWYLLHSRYTTGTILPLNGGRHLV